MQVVAEGIEDDSVLSAVRDFGCDLGQGYHGSPFRWMQTRWASGSSSTGRPAERRVLPRRTARTLRQSSATGPPGSRRGQNYLPGDAAGGVQVVADGGATV